MASKPGAGAASTALQVAGAPHASIASRSHSGAQQLGSVHSGTSAPGMHTVPDPQPASSSIPQGAPGPPTSSGLGTWQEKRSPLRRQARGAGHSDSKGEQSSAQKGTDPAAADSHTA